MADFQRRIAVKDVNGAEVLRYLKLGDGRYYGGATCDAYCNLVPGAYGPHMLLTTGMMLDLIAALARLETPLAAYQIESASDGAYLCENLGRRMNSRRLAAVLDVPEATVRDHYAHIVLIDDEPCAGCPPAASEESRKDGISG